MAHSKLHVLGGLLLLQVLGASATPTPDEGNKPIVVQTQLQNYDQPTLRDYEECQENRDKCLDVCAGDSKCKGECPVCPELFSKPVMVQGVNDTDLRAEPQVPVNTTNIIKLTNEIRNIIKHEIQQRNEVNVQVQQNVSQVGGRFGLGYSDLGSCCYVVLMDRKCDKNAGDDCREKSRQRVCGERCQARVMLAKRVVQCDAEDPLNCRETIEYVPRRRRVHAKTSLPSEPCRYFGNSWPYFSCGQNQGEGTGMMPNQRPKRSVCQECLNLPYGYILQSGLPPQCGGCFQGFGSPYMYNPYGFNPFMPFPSYGGYPPNNNPNNDLSNTGNTIGNEIGDKNVEGSGDYILCEDDDVEKCLKENGKQGAPSHQEQAPGFIDDVDDPEYGVETQRRKRRHNNRVFVRSAYSKRNRKHA